MQQEHAVVPQGQGNGRAGLVVGLHVVQFPGPGIALAGPVLTHAPQPGSFPIDAVPLVDCLVATDQRGVARPQGLLCDVGSVEVEP